jgi:hypothetical protein
MSIPVELWSTEDHDYYLQNEAVRESILSLRRGNNVVKRSNNED